MVATTRRCWREHRGEQVLRRGLAGRAGDADDLRAELAPPGGGEALQRGERVVGGQQGPGLRAPRGLGVLGRRRARPTRRRPARRGEAPAVDVLPGRPTKRSPGPASRESIDHARGPGRPRGAGATSRAPGGLGDAAQATTSRTAQRLPRDGDVVERHLAPPASSWPCSWPLPAMTTTSPGAGQLDRARDRLAAVDDRLGARRRLPRGPRAMIASGSSERGLSEVTIDDVGQLARRSRPSAGACRGRGRRRSRRRRSRRPSASGARGAQDVLQRVGRVGVVDEHREALALVDGLEAPGHAARRAAAPRRSPRRRRRAPARRRPRRAR